MDSNENKSQLWDAIFDLEKTNKHFLSVAKEHISRLLEYAERGQTLGPDTFKNEEEYREFAISKFFVDKVLPSLKKVSNPEAEEGEIGSDDEDTRDAPPRVIFPLTKFENTRQTFLFWNGTSTGDVFIAKVVAVGKKIYDLILLYKSDPVKTITVFSISAFLLKESVKETLKVNDLVRVAILGYIQRDDLMKMKVTADPYAMEGLEDKKLGKIYESEIVQPALEDSTQIRWEQVHRHKVMDLNHQNTLHVMSLLGIDPYRPYTFFPGLKSSTKSNKASNRSEASAIEGEAIYALKNAIQMKEFGTLDCAKKYASEAIEKNPDYSAAYAVRGSIILKQAKEEDVDSIMEGVIDCMKSLELNPHNLLARKCVAGLLEECALCLSKDEAHLSYAKNCVEKALEFYETKEAKDLHSTIQSLMDVSAMS